MLGFLFLLDEVAQYAAARGGDVGGAVAAEVVPVAQVGALHRLGDPVQAEAACCAEQEALFCGELVTRSYSARLWSSDHAVGQAYTGVDRLVPLHLAILAQPMVRLAKRDTW